MPPSPFYDRFPTLTPHLDPDPQACVTDWDGIAQHLLHSLPSPSSQPRPVLALECYPGIDEPLLLRELAPRLSPALTLHSRDALLPPPQCESLAAPFLGGNDPVFGFLSDLQLPAFFDTAQVARARRQIQQVKKGLVFVVGCGASLLAHEFDRLVYADLARWEAQQRFRKNRTGNFGASNADASASQKYKRAFFVDWPMADQWKKPLIPRWDFFLDTHQSTRPKLVSGESVRQALRHAVTRPFRVVPFFDPAPWGGQWMRDQFDLPGDAPNYGWCFDCVPEENSLLFAINGETIEMPSLNLLLCQAPDLLGPQIRARFGDEFPIRFDLLDTMGGGHLSFQVHPMTEYIRRNFGMAYTQDESYYLLDAGPEACVYLGLEETIDPKAMERDLRSAQGGGPPFEVARYANRFPARPHDHFLIPAGTVHCSGRDSMVLEISATPYIFTFKLWDWGRLGLDGQPRPVHLEHGLANIQWDRTRGWVEKELINRVEPLGQGPGWREERTGLHPLEFIESTRHWFTDSVPHHTGGGVNVINLVQGEAALVESPDHAFSPFEVHYAETFIVPAAVGPYTIRPAIRKPSRPLATLKARVRT